MKASSMTERIILSLIWILCLTMSGTDWLRQLSNWSQTSKASRVG